jgi:hypothetical protein
VALNKAGNLVNIGVSSVDRLNDVIVVSLDFILSLGVVVKEEHPLHDFIVVFRDITLDLSLDLLEVFVSNDELSSVGGLVVKFVLDVTNVVGDL